MESVYTTGLLSMNKYVKLLLNYPNIDVNIQNEHGVTALMMAVSNSYGFSTEETVKMLLNHPNIDVNIQDENGWTALMYAIKYSNINKRPDGMCVHYQNHHNQNVYDEEIQGTIKLLLEHPNIDTSIVANNGETAYILLVNYQNEEISNLINQMSEPNITLFDMCNNEEMEHNERNNNVCQIQKEHERKKIKSNNIRKYVKSKRYDMVKFRKFIRKNVLGKVY